MAIYMWREPSYITTPGIYYNSDLGLISLSSDGSTWITIADKNLGATTVWNNGDTLSEANCGKYYQRGNNYGLAWTGTISPTNAQVNTSGYGPNNYYSSSFFRISSSWNDWSSPSNNDLWGDVTNTLAARRGPCDEGFHIPTANELDQLYNIGNSLGIWSQTTGGSLFCNYLKIPLAGARGNSSSPNNQGVRTYLKSSTVYANSSVSAYYLVVYQETINSPQHGYAGAKTAAQSIRPFKNEAVQPDDSRTVIYQ